MERVFITHVLPTEYIAQNKLSFAACNFSFIYYHATCRVLTPIITQQVKENWYEFKEQTGNSQKIR